MTCNQDCNQGRTCECEDQHDDWIDEFWALVQTALVWIGVSALGAWVMGVIYGLGTK